MQVLLVVVVPPVDVDAPYPEEPIELLEATSALRALRHGEPVDDLVPGLVAASVPPVWLPDETD